jgi:hypothetical protein
MSIGWAVLALGLIHVETVGDDAGRAITEKDRAFWSFQPVEQTRPPGVLNPRWAKNPIDLFVQARREQQGITPASPADKRTLIRRAYFDLVGLPPKPAEIDAFLRDDSPDAFEKLVDRLLANPAYGERWGRHWLDVARYADTSGDTGDYPIPQAYLYRDWVIDAFNRDLPYDELIRQQLAGDVLATNERDPELYRDGVVATGFLALSRRFGNKKDNLHLTIEDTIDTVGRGIMGLTLKCARCHHHKSDPILLSDYYGLYGIFASTSYPWAGSGFDTVPTGLQALSPNAAVRQDISDRWKKLASYVRQHRDNWQIAGQAKKFRELGERIDAGEKNGDDVSSLIEERAALLDKHEKFREFLVHGRDWLGERVKELAPAFPEGQLGFAVREGKPVDARQHINGDPKQTTDTVTRRFVEVVSRGTAPEIPGGSGRLELASWITSRDHPLTARVIVNRIWQWHFGQGIVATPDNFGHTGARPSHPELLDYLASTFMSDGWSIKKLHRHILLSNVYQLSSDIVTSSAERDPDNHYLWRFTPRRLSAEEVRDAVLAVSGELDASRPGPHPFRPWHEIGYGLNNPFHEVFDTPHRSVYVMTQRLFHHPFFARFGAPDRNETTSHRDPSTTPMQALYLLNAPFVDQQARALARRVLAARVADHERVEIAFETVFGRSPTETETWLTLQFLRDHQGLDQRPRGDSRELDAWAGLAHTLLMTNEFFFVN